MHPSIDWEIARALRVLQQATDDAQRALARRLGMGPTDVAALDHLIGSQTPLGPVELGDLLGIRSASATVLVDRLEQAGHVVREPHPHDRRRRTLKPTERARAEVHTALQPLIGPLQELARTLTDEHARVVLRFLQQAAAVHADYAAVAGPEDQSPRPQSP